MLITIRDTTAQLSSPLPYLAAGPSADDVLQLEADPEGWVRNHLAQLQAAPQEQGLARGTAETEEEEKEGSAAAQCAAHGGEHGQPSPGCGAVGPAAGHICCWQQHSHLWRLDEAQAVVDTDTQPPLLHPQRAASRPGAHLQHQGDKGVRDRPTAALHPQRVPRNRPPVSPWETSPKIGSARPGA